MKILYLLLFSIHLAIAAISTEYGGLVKNLLEYWDIPVRITALVCYSAEESFNFVKSLNKIESNSSKYFPVNIKPIDLKHFPRGENENWNVIVVDLCCENSTKKLLKDVDHSLYLHYKWIILNSRSDQNNESLINGIFFDLPILPSSEIFFFEIEDDGYLVKQIYRTSMQSPIMEEIYGKWFYVNRSIIDLRTVNETSRRRQNLRKALLKASMVITNNDTLNHLTDYRDKHIDTITKVNYHLTNYLIDFLNATVEYSIVSTWGYQDNQTNQWSGMIGELTTKKADLGASPLFFTDDRIQIIQYLAMTSPTRSKFIFRSPKLSYTDNVFLLPFDKYVWICLGALVIVLTAVLFVVIFLEYRTKLTNHNSLDNSTLRPKLFEIFFLIFSATCQQGSNHLPTNSSSRVIAFLTFITFMFLYASYSANIVALLQSPSTRIKTLEDLYNSRLKFGVDDTVFNHYYFSHATDTVRKNIYEFKVKQRDGSENFMNLTDGVRKIRQGLFAFHMELGVGYKIISETFQEDEKCGLQEIQYLQVIDPFYAVQKNSSYSELFKIGLLRLNEIGLQDRENSRLYTKRPKCSGGGAKFISVGLVDIEPAVFFICYGFGVCGIIFVMELLVSFWRKNFKLKLRKNLMKISMKQTIEK